MEQHTNTPPTVEQLKLAELRARAARKAREVTYEATPEQRLKFAQNMQAARDALYLDARSGAFAVAQPDALVTLEDTDSLAPFEDGSGGAPLDDAHDFSKANAVTWEMKENAFAKMTLDQVKAAMAAEAARGYKATGPASEYGIRLA